jgi:hypothetical protein
MLGNEDEAGASAKTELELIEGLRATPHPSFPQLCLLEHDLARNLLHPCRLDGRFLMIYHTRKKETYMSGLDYQLHGIKLFVLVMNWRFGVR